MPDQQTDDVTTDDLSAAVIDGEPRHYDFRGHTAKWDVAFERTDEEVNEEQHAPMMNTLWPLPDNFEIPDDVRDRLDNMTVVSVYGGPIRDGTFLALTGGGMDMSWAIARTYVNLGYLPPAALGKLPEMGGMDFNAPQNERVIRALSKSHKHMIDRLSNYRADLARLGK